MTLSSFEITSRNINIEDHLVMGCKFACWIYQYLFNFVETPCKFAIAKLSIRKDLIIMKKKIPVYGPKALQ